MHRILADASLPGVSELFKPLQVTLYANFDELQRQLKDHNILMCRSTLRVNGDLLKNSNINIVGTASSGIDHFDKPWLNAHNVQTFSAKGANAQAVADYVCMVLAWLKRSKNWRGSTAGIIGCGCVGSAVQVRFESLGFKVFTYDPWRENDPNFHHCDLSAIQQCDIVSVHCNYHHHQPYPSHQLINQSFIHGFNQNGVLINTARGEVVDENALLHSPLLKRYCSDVFCNEPQVNATLINQCLLATPHIAGHTIEAKYNAVLLLAQQLFHHLQLTPSTALKKQENLDFPINPSNAQWPQHTLAVYNPNIDNQALKKSQEKSKIFMQIRKNHRYRHNLNWGFC